MLGQLCQALVFCDALPFPSFDMTSPTQQIKNSIKHAQALRDGHAPAIIEAAWIRYSHRQVMFVNWERHPLARLQLIAGA
jgi:hypothetical protein